VTTEDEAIAQIDASEVEEAFNLQAQKLCDRGITAETVEIAMGLAFVRRLLETRGGPVAAAEQLHHLARTLAAGEVEKGTMQ
jgi:hypothetical protein